MGTSPEQVDLVLKQFPNATREYFDDEQPRHRVRITKIDALARHEVTVGQFGRFVADTGYKTEAERDGKGAYGFNVEKGTYEQDPKYTWRNPGFPQSDDHPVTCVSWNDANEFCRWLSGKDGRTYRLPTEAEWEYACRAGSESRYSFGDDPEGLARVGNAADASAKARFASMTWAIKADDGFVFTAPVGRYAANAWGLFDMHGNVWEWCLDGYDAAYYKSSPEVDPGGAGAGAAHRVIRGGSWRSLGRYCRSATRYRSSPDYRNDLLGFRVARVSFEQ
jgi:formylglycine-generating enzyme required for sulfatase activity